MRFFTFILISLSACAKPMYNVNVKIYDLEKSQLVSDFTTDEIDLGSKINKLDLKNKSVLVDDRKEHSDIGNQISLSLFQSGWNVKSFSSINTTLKIEKIKDIFGCDKVRCYAEIAGAYNLRYYLRYRVDKHIRLKQEEIYKRYKIHKREKRVERDKEHYEKAKRFIKTRLQAVAGISLVVGSLSGLLWLISSSNDTYDEFSEEQERVFRNTTLITLPLGYFLAELTFD